MRKTRTKCQIILIVEVTILGLLAPLFLLYSPDSPFDRARSSDANSSDHTSRILVAFASTEGQVRCSDGKLVSSPGECPATDQCPPPQNNTISNCVPGVTSNGNPPEAQNLTSNETSNETNSSTTSSSENTTARCYEDRSTPHTPRCNDDSD